MKKYFSVLILITMLFCLVGCNKVKYDENGYQKETNLKYKSNQDENAEVKNIILIIGDGMGENHVTLADLIYHNGEKGLDVDKYEYKSMMETNCLDNVVTDSAASATAMATGVKTLYERVGMDEDGNELKTILDYAYEKGMATGVVTDQDLNDATPAGFTAHSLNRYTNVSNMINDQIKGTTSVLFGLNYKGYTIYKDEIAAQGWSYVTTYDEFMEDESDKLFATFNLSKGAAPKLYEMMQKALDILSRDEDGFFLMLEAGSIDERANDADAQGVADEVLMLDRSLRVALNFMRSNDNTIVIVLADHETGGLVIKDGTPDKTWFTEPTYYHTNVDVPVYAFGTRSNIFDNKEFKNSDLLGMFLELLDIEK